LDRRWGKPDEIDPRTSQAIRDENEALRIANATLKAQLDELKIVVADRESLGEIGKDSRQYKVITADAGNREAISIGASSLSGVADGMPVIYKGGLAGRVLRAGLTSSSILLITDRDAKPMTVAFGRFVGEGDAVRFVEIADSIIVRGAGNNSLVSNLMTMKDADGAGIRVGDWCVLKDAGWPANLRGYRIGQVTSKTPRPDSPLFAKIVIEPSTKLRLLNEVSVVLK
jgi:cell shape-determining protein MreC